MADIKDRTDPFKFPSRRLSAGDLNEMRESTFRQVIGSGSARTRKYGDRLLIDGDEQYQRWQDPFMSFAVRQALDDVLLCTPLVMVANIGMPYNPSLGGDQGVTQMYVAKPYLLRRTAFDGQMVLLENNQTVTFQYTDGNHRTARSDALSGGIVEAQTLIPPYFIGEIITARFGPTGMLANGNPIYWTDTNEGARQWAFIPPS